jgi:hypothetical protein
VALGFFSCLRFSAFERAKPHVGEVSQQSFGVALRLTKYRLDKSNGGNCEKQSAA